MPRSGVVVIGGDPPHPGVVARLPADRYVVAADSGLDHAEVLGLGVDVVVGDLDSVSPGALARARAAGVPVVEHPVDKDATDAELAVDLAVATGCRHVVVVGGGGDRLDHVLAALGLLARPLDVRVEAWWGRAHVRVLHGPASLDVEGGPGQLVSLVPLGGACTGITTTGLRYPLHGETLAPLASRGISNEVLGRPARVALGRGALAVIVPYALGGAP